MIFSSSVRIFVDKCGKCNCVETELVSYNLFGESTDGPRY